MALQELAANVFASVEGDLGVSVGLIHTTEGVVALDTTMAALDMQRLLDQAGIRAGDVALVVNTHFHSDHTWGNQLFDCPILAHELCRKRMAANLSGPWSEAGLAAWVVEMNKGIPGWAEMAQKKWANLSIVLPTDTFSDRRALEMGGKQIELIHLGGHTPGLSVIWLPQERILFASDLLFIGRYPFMGDCSVPDWIAALDRLVAFDARVIVPGHGPLCGEPQISALRSYLAESWALTADHVARGHRVEVAVADPAYPVYAEGQQERHQMNIRIMYEKMQEGR